ncbi:MAG: M20/M25/M40 family metallo-hydrolase [Planctomycetes bacterium]|nr:M20/M25/M40 family metallo-hydrolase [Planctomycetota bacterium]
MLLRISPFVLLTALLAAQAPEVAVTQAAAKPPEAMATIQQKELLAHATFLASDELKGRLTGSPGQFAAAKYIADHFARLGLEPLGDEVEGKRTWLQHYGVSRTFVVDGANLQFGALTLENGFAILGGKPFEAAFDAKAAFVGLGRKPAGDAGLDLDGKVAVAVVKPLKGKLDKSLTIEQKFMASFSTFGQLGKTAKALAKRGAAAVLFVQLADPNGLSDTLNYLAAAPGKDSLVANFEGADPGMGAVAQMLGSDGGVPTLVLSVPASAQVLGELGLAVDAVTAYAAGGEMPAAKDGVAVKGKLGLGTDANAKASNVVAVLRGSDPKLAHEAIVFSAHMDHVGTRIDGEVFNGADDNASGSAGLLAIASAFANSKEKPRRSVIFLSVSGEELGLWGSAYFADNPTWDPALLVANVNTDMIGRNGPESSADQVTVTPSNRHAKFSTIVQDAARFGETLGLSFESGDKYYERSDHFNFAKKGIPVVFFCNGEHEDYHQVTDHADKLSGEKMEKIARLAFWTGWAVANADDRPRKLGKRESWR